MSIARLREIKVLIADDQKIIQRLVQAVLTELGFRDVTVCNSGREAIAQVKKQPFDIVITDWRMADLDGIDLLRFIRTDPFSLDPYTPVILLTGNAELRDITKARDAGVTEYLVKPFSAQDLISRIRSVIENPRSFILAPEYHGPDRRRQARSILAENERRKEGNK